VDRYYSDNVYDSFTDINNIFHSSIYEYKCEWVIDNIFNSSYFYIFDNNPASKNYWAKLLISGMFITISMTGLDQEMMQKNLSISTLKNSQKT